MNIMDFGHNSFVTWTRESLDAEKENQMSDKTYICLSGYNHHFTEDELHCCPKCGEFSCPICGGEISTTKEYDEAMEANSRES